MRYSSPRFQPGFEHVEGRHFADLTDDLQRTIDDAGFKPINPRYLPEGFRVIGAENSTFRGMKNLHLLYSDGIRTLSLFENDADSEPDFGGVKPSVTHFEGHDAQYVKGRPDHAAHLARTWPRLRPHRRSRPQKAHRDRNERRPLSATAFLTRNRRGRGV